MPPRHDRTARTPPRQPMPNSSAVRGRRRGSHPRLGSGTASSGSCGARSASDDTGPALALLVAAVCWYFGADVWHSILIGSALTTVGLISLVATDNPDFGNTDWRS